MQLYDIKYSYLMQIIIRFQEIIDINAWNKLFSIKMTLGESNPEYKNPKRKKSHRSHKIYALFYTQTKGTTTVDKMSSILHG